MDIKVGEYVRTTKGTIAKIDDEEFDLCINIPDRRVFYKKWVEDFLGSYTVKEEVKKHSFNIIDLIEVGDYVNGYKVLEIADSIYKNSKRILIYQNEKEKYERWIYIQEYDGKIHTQDDIKTIVTKEQFEAMEYEV